MKKTLALLTLLLVVGTLEPRPPRALAGPYQGFGADTAGGAGGTVVHVTNLNDSGPGSFREAVSFGNRTVVFDVAGEILLAGSVFVLGPFVTIDGFTAPPPGIILRNRGLAIHGDQGAHDIIVRGLRVRNASPDGFQVKNGAYNVVIDHCSVHGSADGNLDITESSHDVTVSWSIFAEPAGGQKNALIKYNPSRVTLHHNIFVGARKRNPLLQIDNAGTPAVATTLDMRNNLVWDWGDPDPTLINYGTLVGWGARANIVNNFYSAPTASAADQAKAVIVCEGDCYAGDVALIEQLPPHPDPASGATAYVAGNVSADQLPSDINSEGNQPSAFTAPFVETQEACAAAGLVLADAGVRPLDAIDQAYLAQIELGTCFPGVDLAVVSLALPASVAPGSSVVVSETIENRGQEQTGGFQVAFYLSTDATLDAGDVFLGSRTVTGLASRERSSAVTPLNIPAGIALGIHHILVWADTADEVVELSEANNVRSAAITVGPNLIASSLTVSSPGAPGVIIDITDAVVNGGAQPPAGTSVRFHLSTNTAFDAGDVLLGSRTLPALGAGATNAAVTSFTIPAQTPVGAYYVIARVDPDNLVSEADEADNLRAAPVTVTISADLTIKGVDAPGTVARGATISVSDSVKNTGKGPAPGSIVTFRLSTNPTYEETDVMLGSRQVPPVAAKASNSGVTQVTIPVGTTPGNYYIVALIETANGAPETTTVNNAASSRRLKVR